MYFFSSQYILILYLCLFRFSGINQVDSTKSIYLVLIVHLLPAEQSLAIPYNGYHTMVDAPIFGFASAEALLDKQNA